MKLSETMNWFFNKWLSYLTAAMLAAIALSAIANAATTINVDMDHGPTYSGTAAAPDSGGKWNSLSAAGTLTTVQDSQSNTLAGVTITFASSGSVNIYYDATSGSPNPSALMSDYTFGATYTLTIAGLTPNQPYGLYAYSHGNVDNQTGTITLGAANGGASASTKQTGDTGNFRNIYMYGQGYDYVVLNGNADNSGTFTFTVANYLNGFQLQKLSAPAIAGLTNQTVVAGTTATLSPTISGTPPPNLQWSSNSIPLVGQTNASLVLNNVQYSQNNTVYSLVASNYPGAVTNSMTLSVIVTPSVTGLNNQAAPTGTTVAISATVSGVPTPSTQWQFNGSNLSDGPTGHGSTIAGTLASTLYITNAQPADSGTYSLVASNSAGIVTNSMTLTVSSGNVAPSITGPADQSVVQNSNAIFTVSVSGLPVPTLQWLVNGTSISGATNSSLSVTNVQFSQNGYVYSLVASNSAGMATNSARLYVLVPPMISQQPTNFTVVAGNSAAFSIIASGVPAVSYQWNRNGSPIVNATSATYTLANPQGADNGALFSVTVSNSVRVVTSSNAVLTVLSTMTGTFLPTNGAANISPDQQLRIVFAGGLPRLNSNGVFTVRDTANNSVVQTIDASQFLSYTPGNTSIQTIPNAAIRTEQGTYFGSGPGTTTYYYMPIALYGNEAWVTLTNRLAYGHTYYVTCDTGLFSDSTGALFPGITGTNTWRFSTKVSGPAMPTASTGPTSITVGQDGTGDFATFQGAFDWIPQSNTLARTIHVLPGIYRDSATLAGSRNFVTIVGDGASRTNAQLIYPFIYFAPPNPVFTAGSLRIESSDVGIENITLDNIIYGTYHPTGYSSSGAASSFAGAINTLATTGQRIVFNNVLIKGGQDTIYNVNGVAYYYNSEVWGSVDFIYGAALAVFDQCKIVEIRNTGGPCTAPNTAYAQPYGITFLNCTFPQAYVSNGYPYDVAAGNTTFMRPWGKDGMTAAINCAVGNQFSSAGYQTFGNTNEDECRAREYGTTLIGGGALNIPTNRWNAGAYWANTYDPDYINPIMDPTNPLLAPPTGTNNRAVVTINPGDYTLPAIFGNSYFNLNGWMPSIVPIITSQPTNQTINSGSNAVFIVAGIGLPNPAYQWQKNGTNLLGQISSALTITNAQMSDAGTYSVIVSNSAGFVTSSNALLVVNTPVSTTSTAISVSVSPGVLQLSWPADHIGWHLEVQTNGLGMGLGTNWTPVAESYTTNQITIPIDSANLSTFYRLAYP
jgi:pectin methylesterase-like acyl-CoA thioesterase